MYFLAQRALSVLTWPDRVMPKPKVSRQHTPRPATRSVRKLVAANASILAAIAHWHVTTSSAAMSKTIPVAVNGKRLTGCPVVSLRLALAFIEDLD